MADIISTVGDGHGTPDYATLALWNSGEGSVDPGVGFTSIANCSGFCGSSANINGTFVRGATIQGDVTFDGANVSALADTDRLTISVAAGINVYDLRLYTNNEFVSAMNYNADNIIMDRVVFDNTTAGVNALDVNGDFPSGSISNFIARGGLDVINCGFSQGTNLTNGLVYGGSDKGFEGSGSTAVITKVFAFNNTGEDFDSAGGFTLVDCASEDATGNFTGYTSAELVNFIGVDLRTKSTSFLADAATGSQFIGAFLESGGGGGEILAIDSGSYTLTGSNVSLTAQYKSTLESGSYSLSGGALGLIHDSKLIADSGTYSLTGTQASLMAARKVITDSGSYNLTGTDVTLVYTPIGGGEVLSIDSGTFSLSGSDIELKAARLISVNAGSYNLTGQSVALTYNAKTIVDSGSYALAGSNVNLFANRVIIAQNGSYNLTGSTVTLRYSGEVTQVIGTVSTTFAADKYSVSYKPTSITVNFKE